MAKHTIRDVDYKLLKDGFTLKWAGLRKYRPRCRRAVADVGLKMVAVYVSVMVDPAPDTEMIV